MWPLAWSSVNELEPAVCVVSVLFVSVLMASFWGEFGGDTAPPACVAPPAAPAAASAPVDAALEAEALASAALSARLEQAPSDPATIAALSSAAVLNFICCSPWFEPPHQRSTRSLGSAGAARPTTP